MVESIEVEEKKQQIEEEKKQLEAKKEQLEEEKKQLEAKKEQLEEEKKKQIEEEKKQLEEAKKQLEEAKKKLKKKYRIDRWILNSALLVCGVAVYLVCVYAIQNMAVLDTKNVLDKASTSENYAQVLGNISGILATLSVGIMALAFIFFKDMRSKTYAFVIMVFLVGCSISSSFVIGMKDRVDIQKSILYVDIIMIFLFVWLTVDELFKTLRYEEIEKIED